MTAPDFSKANMPLPLLMKGVGQYTAHGIPPAKLIRELPQLPPIAFSWLQFTLKTLDAVAFPWFAYSWKCGKGGHGPCCHHCNPALATWVSTFRRMTALFFPPTQART